VGAGVVVEDGAAEVDGSGSETSTVGDGTLATDPHPVSTEPKTTGATSHRRTIRLERAVRIGFAARSAIMATI
jgi:hypothetical protein